MKQHIHIHICISQLVLAADGLGTHDADCRFVDEDGNDGDGGFLGEWRLFPPRFVRESKKCEAGTLHIVLYNFNKMHRCAALRLLVHVCVCLYAKHSRRSLSAFRA